MEKKKFYELAEQMILGMLPAEYAGYDVKIFDTANQYGSYKGMSIIPPGVGATISPSINLDRMYETFGQLPPMESLRFMGEEVAKILQETKQIEQTVLQEAKEITGNYAVARSHLYVATISEERQKTLDKMLYRMEYGFPLMARIDMQGLNLQNDVACSFEVTSQLVQNWGVTFDQVYQDAMTNTQRLYPPKIISLSQVMEDLAGIEFMEEEGANLYVVTNEAMNHGAATILLPGIKEQLAAELGDSYMVFPSSIHECLVQSLSDWHGGIVTEADVREMHAIIDAVNNESVSAGEVLGHEPYFYNRKTGEFSKAIDAVKAAPDHMLFSDQISENRQKGTDTPEFYPGL